MLIEFLSPMLRKERFEFPIVLSEYLGMCLILNIIN